MRLSLPRAAGAAILVIAAGSCTGDRSVVAPPTADTTRQSHKLDISATASDALLMVRTPSAAPGERGGTTVQLGAVVANKKGHELPNKEHVSWRSTDESKATVDSTGLIAAQDTGVVDVIVDYKDYEEYSKAADTVRVVVVPVPVVSVTVAGPDSASVDDTVSFTATPRDSVGEPLLGRDVSWESSAPSVATVSASGEAVALSIGATVVTATCEEVQGSAPIQIWPQPVATITVTPGTASVPLFRTATFMATLLDRRGKVLTGRTVAWSSSAPAVLTVGASGELTTADVGEASVVAESEGKQGSAAVTVTNPVEARALWVTRFDYTGSSAVVPGKIATIMAKAASANFNVVYFQVRTSGDALYASSIEPCSPRVCGTLGGPLVGDPLADALREAAKYGIQVHAWLNSYTGWIAGSSIACSQLTPPNPVVPPQMTVEHPDWRMLDVNRLPQPCLTTSEYTWVSPGVPAVRSRLAQVAADIARRYGPLGLKGIHLDRIRYPSTAVSYDSASVLAYKARYGVAPVAGTTNWANFRREMVNTGVREVRDSLNAIDPSLVLSAAVFPGYKPVAGWAAAWSYQDYFQDPSAWASGGYLDVAVPMAYPALATSASWTVKAYCSNTDWTCVLDEQRSRIEGQSGKHVYIGVGAIRGWADVDVEIATGHARHVNGFSVYDFTKMDAIPDGWAKLKAGHFKYPASIPPMTWK